MKDQALTGWQRTKRGVGTRSGRQTNTPYGPRLPLCTKESNGFWTKRQRRRIEPLVKSENILENEKAYVTKKNIFSE